LKRERKGKRREGLERIDIISNSSDIEEKTGRRQGGAKVGGKKPHKAGVITIIAYREAKKKKR
jgi:hypothetical protein